MRTPHLTALALLAAVAAVPGTSVFAQSGTPATPAQPGSKPPAAQAPGSGGRSAKAPAAPAAKPARAPGTAALMKQAAAATAERKLDEALALYAKAVRLQPSLTEAHWYVGVLNYDLDRYEPARNAFRRVIELSPEKGEAWTLKGLCEFQLKNYESALTDLVNGRRFGFGGNPEIVSVARYHLAVLLTRDEEFDQGGKLLSEFANEGNDAPRVIEAMGIATLRMPLLPSEVPSARREMVMMAGRATFYSGARLVAAAEKAFEELVERFPETPHVHYAFGSFLVNEQADRALEEFKAELKVSQHHPLAKLQIAYEYIRRGEWDAARPWAEQAVAEAPTNFSARKAYGQVLLETGDMEGAITHLEAGVKLAPDSPALRFTLASAYRRAGRAADAAREQAEFTRLDRMLRTERTGAQSVGGMDLEPPRTPQ
jgi:tetratricopeptide (TPR) repeat protein